MAEEIKRVFKVNGKEVRIRPRLSLAEGRKLQALLDKATGPDLHDWVPLAQLLLEPCEMVANPADAAAYDALDVFEDIMPMQEILGTYVLGRVNAAREQAKN